MHLFFAMKNTALLQGLGLKPASQIGEPQRRQSVPFTKGGVSMPAENCGRATEPEVRAAVGAGNEAFLALQMPIYGASEEGRTLWVRLMTEGLRPALNVGNATLYEMLACYGADVAANVPAVVHSALRGNLTELATELVDECEVSVFEKPYKARMIPGASTADRAFCEFLANHPALKEEAKRWRGELPPNLN
jgi:hypothetical protein